MTKSRIISAIIALAYVVGAYAGGGWGLVLQVGPFLLLPLACIWFPDEIGGYTGMMMQGGPMTSTPGWLTTVCGWCLLLLPFIVAPIVWLLMPR